MLEVFDDTTNSFNHPSKVVLCIGRIATGLGTLSVRITFHFFRFVNLSSSECSLDYAQINPAFKKTSTVNSR